MEVVKDHIESQRLLNLAQMGFSIDEPDWAHIDHCEDCETALFMLRFVIKRSRVENDSGMEL
jgi:hypothetical protein